MMNPDGQLAHLSLQEIENDDWGDPLPDDTELVKRCMLLRRKPLDEFDDDDLLEMVTQRKSPDVLVPMALGMLAANPWLGGVMYTGGLLAAVTRTRDRYWQAHPDQAAAFERLVASALSVVDEDPGFVPGGDTDVWPPDNFPGDAVFGLMAIDAGYWSHHREQHAIMRSIVARAKEAGLLSEEELEFSGSLYSHPIPEASA